MKELDYTVNPGEGAIKAIAWHASECMAWVRNHQADDRHVPSSQTCPSLYNIIVFDTIRHSKCGSELTENHKACSIGRTSTSTSST